MMCAIFFRWCIQTAQNGRTPAGKNDNTHRQGDNVEKKRGGRQHTNGNEQDRRDRPIPDGAVTVLYDSSQATLLHKRDRETGGKHRDRANTEKEQ